MSIKGGLLSQELFYSVNFVSIKVVTEKRMLRNDFVLAVGKLLKADTRKYSHNPAFPDMKLDYFSGWSASLQWRKKFPAVKVVAWMSCSVMFMKSVCCLLYNIGLLCSMNTLWYIRGRQYIELSAVDFKWESLMRLREVLRSFPGFSFIFLWTQNIDGLCFNLFSSMPCKYLL